MNLHAEIKSLEQMHFALGKALPELKALPEDASVQDVEDILTQFGLAC